MLLDHPRYTARETLGHGAQGRVVRVVDRERPALPLVAKVVAGDPSRLAGEFALLARLRAPGLVRVHDLAKDAAGLHFLVEDLVDGDEPRAAVGNDGARLVAIAAELAETLAALHDAGFVHGDIKPGNVRVPRGSRAVLLDLGAAVAGAAMHTPAFAAPELRAGAPHSVASDLFGLGATLWACADAEPRTSVERIRDRAPWVPPHLADLIAKLLAEHPADRPRSARDVLAALGRVNHARGPWEAGRSEHVRESEVRAVLALEAGPTNRRVVYVQGPSGAGKSHLVREVVTRALLSGRDARLIVSREGEPEQLLAYLRGARESFAERSDAPLLIVLDELHDAREELVEALESFRCMTARAARPVVIVATTRSAPARADGTITLGALDDAAFARLCAAENVHHAREHAREAAGLPGWLFAALGRVPLTKEAALARVAALGDGAKDVLALVATLGGTAPERVLDASAVAACFEAGLLTREGAHEGLGGVRLASPHLATDLAAALASYDLSDRAAALALDDDTLPASTLAAVTRAELPPARRAELLARTAERARSEDARAIEIEALLALVAEPKERTGERVARLERLVRDAGRARAHPQVLGWLEENLALAPLARRRRAEERARAGDMPAARAAADEAIALTRGSIDEVYALATRGSIDLWCAEWAAAAKRFSAARDLAGTYEAAALDEEELARLEHNLGVVALYRDEVETAALAFERSVSIKRALGDRIGVRACLLNLGLALTRLERWSAADDALREASALADALGEPLGRGWCLAARADLEVRRGQPREAERRVAEAETMGDVLPSAVRADLVVLRAQIALLEGDGAAALAALARLDAGVRLDDALVDARALALEARGRLSLLPADRRGAARCAIASLRRARAADLPEAATEAARVLRAARGSSKGATPPMKETVMTEHVEPANDAPIWEVLRALGSESTEACVVALARHVAGVARAERVLIAEVGAGGDVVRAWGVDLDGLAIAEPAARVDREAVRAARARESALYQPILESAAGSGARLALARGRAALVIDHRFRTHAFDHVTMAVCARWLTIAEIALRLDGSNAPAAEEGRSAARAAPSPTYDHASTALPRREALRDFPTIVGGSPALRQALAQLDVAVDADLPVLVEGETGTGKEVFARALHDHGPRRTAPFVAVNCAAIADSLFEAEVFGHARGAFTGADRARPGLLARAEGGTLLLDELGELAPARQATLLRVLEERRYRPVGTDDERAFDVRIVAATNRDLDQAVAEGTFRRDLLYRLRVLRVTVPPLRERRDDVVLLFRHFLSRAGCAATVTAAAQDALESYDFPGNVRELAHVAQRLAAARLDRIDVANLPREVRAVAPATRADSTPAGIDRERDDVERALARTGGNITRAATVLGLTRHGLKKRMLRLGLRVKESAS